MPQSIVPLVCERCKREFLQSHGGRCRKCKRVLCHACLPPRGQLCVDCGGKGRWYDRLWQSRRVLSPPYSCAVKERRT